VFLKKLVNYFLIPISLDVQTRRREQRQRQEFPSPIPYTEFSVIDLLGRVVSGPKIGDIVQTNTLSSCVIQKIQSDGTYVVHLTYWHEASQQWRSPNTRVSPSEITAYLGYAFDENKAKQQFVVDAEY